MTKRTNHKEVFQQEMLNSVLESLNQEIIPWEKPWDNYSGLPMNAVTNKAYNGGNSMNLLFSGLSKGLKDPRWCTFKQAKSQGWSIKKGSTSSKIFFISLIDKRNGKPINSFDFDGLTQSQVEELRNNTVPLYRTYSVFNAEQIDGIPDLDRSKVLRPKFDDRKTLTYLDDLVKGMNLPLSHYGDRAFYVPLEDRVQLPQKEYFKTFQGYVETYLHEVTHATGHSSRLDRNLGGGFGTEKYAQEELVADITSMLTAIDLGIIHSERQIENTKSYCQNWHQKLKSNPEVLPKVLELVYEARSYLHEKGKWIVQDMNVIIEENEKEGPQPSENIVDRNETSIEPNEVDLIPNSVAFGHTMSDEGYDQLQAYIKFHEGKVHFSDGNETFDTRSIQDYDITETVMLDIINHHDEKTEELLDNIVADLYSSHNTFLESRVESPESIETENDLMPDECSFDFDDMSPSSYKL